MSTSKTRCTLDRALSKLGICSRKEALVLIRGGAVRVDATVCRDVGRFVTVGSTRIVVEGHDTVTRERRVILLHKTKGVVTTKSDERGRPTVYSLLPADERDLHPIGRLDQATSGLLLFTNDNMLSARLTDPKNAIARVYLVTVRGEVTDIGRGKLLKGIVDDGEKLQAADVTVRKASRKETHLVVTLRTGKNREIRRLLRAIGHEVTALKRVEFGGLKLGTLPAGKCRQVSEKEIREMFP